MNKTEFAVIADELLAKVDAIGMDDHQTGLNALHEFKSLTNKYRDYLPPDATDSASLIESDFDKVRRYKDSRNIPRQYEQYHSSISLLKHIITEMKHANQFPD